MDMSKKAYNSPERIKRRNEGYRVFSDRNPEPTKEEQIKDMEAWQKGIDENYNKSERTPEQQRNDMFKTMDDASKKEEGKREVFEGITFEELQNKVIEKGGKDGKIFLEMRNLSEKMSKELCVICNKTRDTDSRGFITIPDKDGKIYKIHYECVLKLVKEKIRYKGE